VPSEPRRPIAVICALAEELIHLEQALPPGREAWRANRCVWHTELNGQPIVLALCGLGMMSAAAVTESVIVHERPSAILNYGCTGAHRADLLPGDVVLGARVVATDNQSERPNGEWRYFGMRYLRRAVQERDVPSLPADRALLERAVKVAAELEGRHEPWPVHLGWPDEVAHRTPELIVGTVASADRWNRRPASIERLVALHDTHCEDMEAAAIAMTCASHDVPFLTIKDISNNELLKVTESGTALVEMAAAELGRRASAVVLGLLHDLAATPIPPGSEATEQESAASG
jgi:adenosylhomocysteine nucleosidase